MPTTVLIADDHPLVLAGLRRALQPQPDIVLVGEARTAAELLELTRRRHPHIVVMDLSMPGMAGIEAIERIRRERPLTRVVVLSATDEAATVDAALAAGAHAYALKSAHAVDIASLIRRVVGGELVRPGAPGTPELTDRERSILSALAAGMTTAAMSRELWISEHAITLHLTNIYRKLGVTSRAEALRHAREDVSPPVGRPAGK